MEEKEQRLKRYALSVKDKKFLRKAKPSKSRTIKEHRRKKIHISRRERVTSPQVLIQVMFKWR